MTGFQEESEKAKERVTELSGRLEDTLLELRTAVQTMELMREAEEERREREETWRERITDMDEKGRLQQTVGCARANVFFGLQARLVELPHISSRTHLIMPRSLLCPPGVLLSYRLSIHLPLPAMPSHPSYLISLKRRILL